MKTIPVARVMQTSPIIILWIDPTAKGFLKDMTSKQFHTWRLVVVHTLVFNTVIDKSNQCWQHKDPQIKSSPPQPKMPCFSLQLQHIIWSFIVLFQPRSNLQKKKYIYYKPPTNEAINHIFSQENLVGTHRCFPTFMNGTYSVTILL